MTKRHANTDKGLTKLSEDAQGRELEHPMKEEHELVRRIILGIDPRIREAIKWNAPSFFVTQHFATFNLRDKGKIRLILHTGASRNAKKAVNVADPERILEWLGKDRAMVQFSDAREIKAKRKALEGVLRAWMAEVEAL